MAMLSKRFIASDKAYQLPAHGRWFSPASFTTKAGRHVIDEILLKVALNTKNQIKKSTLLWYCCISILIYSTYILLSIVHRNWGVWGAWNSCSTTGGDGILTRHRSCDSSAPAHGGSHCPAYANMSIYFMLLLSVYCFHSSALISFAQFMNPTHCEVYSIQHYVIHFISELW